MITWIASYPKSGNTWMKLFLKCYFNGSSNNFSINNRKGDIFTIETFPMVNKFKEMNINFLNFEDIAKNWIEMQTLINLNNKTNYLKTHNAMCSINNYQFTNNQNTIGAIYIVRDPRDIALSYASFLNKKIDDTIDYMISDNAFEQDLFQNTLYKKSVMGSWSYHYNSWKNYKAKKIIIVKYEDMITKTNDTFFRILKYLSNINNIEINEKKMFDAINVTSFTKLKKLEDEDGFEENPTDKPFFRNGQVGEWKLKLKKSQIEKIENKFSKEMKELKYI